MQALIKLMVLVSLTFSGCIFMSYTDYSRIIDRRFLIGATYMELDKTFFQVIDNEITKEVESRGDHIISLDGCLDATRQIEEINYLISLDVDLLIINPVNATLLEPALAKAKEAGIPVVLVDSTVDDENLYNVAVISDNYNAGRLCAQYMETQLSQANILILDHDEVISANQRIQGFVDYLENDANYQIINSINCLGQTDISYHLVKEYLDQNQDIDALMALNDTSALGALAAINSENLDIKVYGVDGSPEIKKLLISNKNIQATAGQSPIQLGQGAIESGYKLIFEQDVPKIVKMDVSLITKENVKDYNILGWQ